jgi:purine-binding chemotaxis protein CheW
MSNQQTMTQHLGNDESAMWATFMLNGETFALQVHDVQEVLMHQPLTPVPLAPVHIIGLLNLRGQIMSAIDLRCRLNFPARADNEETKVLVLKTREGLTSIVVDDIGDVLELPTAQWRSTPETLADQHRKFVFGICPVENNMVLGLKVDELTSDDEIGR